MKSWLERSRTLLVVIVLFCLLANPVMAVSGLLDIAPQSILISTEPGAPADTGFTVLNLDASPQNFTVSYVRSAVTEKTRVLESRYVSFPGDPVSLPSQESIDILFNVSTGELDPGEYQGTIRVLANASLLTVPVIVKVRHPVLWPIIVLFVSAGLSVILFNYGLVWQKRTVLRRNAAALRAKVESDEVFSKNEFARFFREKVNTTLDIAGGKIRDNDYTGAEEVLKNANKYWDWWNTNRLSWLPELDDSAAAIKRIQEVEQQYAEYCERCTFFGELRDGYRKFWREAVNPPENNTLSFNALTELERGLSRIERVLGDLQGFRKFCQEINDQAEKKACCQKLLDYGKTLQDMKLSDIDPDKIHDHLEGMKGVARKGPVALPRGLQAPKGKPRTVTLTPAQEEEVLSRQLLWFEFVLTTILPVGLLVIIGLYLLYFSNPTFGSPTDYLGMIIWGFMSCATNEGVWEKIASLNPTKTAQIS